MASPALAPEPTAARRQLGRRLKEIREQTRQSVDQVVADRRLGMSRAKLFKLEAGKHAARPQDVTVLGTYYGLAGDALEELVTLALGSAAPNWWHSYGASSAPAWFSLYLGVEPSAAQVRTYESELIPGLLQTQTYASEVYRASNPNALPAEVDSRVGLRMQRQRILTRTEPAPPELHVVLNEAVVRRQVGGAAVMTEQITALREAADRPNVDISVLPFSAGAHAAMESAFVILDFADPATDPPLVYLDSPGSATYLQKPEELSQYEAIFDLVQKDAVPIKEWTP